jgi:hypothetical protein
MKCEIRAVRNGKLVKLRVTEEEFWPITDTYGGLTRTIGRKYVFSFSPDVIDCIELEGLSR